MNKDISFADLSNREGQLVEISLRTLKKNAMTCTDAEWKSGSGPLDEISVLNLPRPGTPEEERELADKFMAGMRKLFSRDDNWAALSMLETSMDYCAQCNTCAESCHLFEGSNRNELYRPNFRSELFRRIYKRYIKKEPLSRWRYRDARLNWQTIVRLGEMAYRCNLCRRCAQTCPIGVDNALIAREIRKLFSQEMGIHPRELHEKGSELQLTVGSTTGMTPQVARETMDFIDGDYSEQTGYTFRTPWDVQGADILLVHNAGEMLAWPDAVAAFSIIFQAAGLSWTMSSDLAAYDAVNYGCFYDDVQMAKVVVKQIEAAKKLGVGKIVVGECGHAHKSLMILADRLLPPEMNTPRVSCFSLFRDIILSGKLKLDPKRNDFEVALHDPCNIARMSGVVRAQRDVLRAVCLRFAEMTPHGADNYCCGGGGGAALISRNNMEEWRMNISGRKKLEQIANRFADCLGPETRKYVCAPCSNCKSQLRGLFELNDLQEKYSIRHGGLAEIIVNAMVDIRPGYLSWE